MDECTMFATFQHRFIILCRGTARHVYEWFFAPTHPRMCRAASGARTPPSTQPVGGWCNGLFSTKENHHQNGNIHSRHPVSTTIISKGKTESAITHTPPQLINKTPRGWEKHPGVPGRPFWPERRQMPRQARPRIPSRPGRGTWPQSSCLHTNWRM